MDPTDPSIESVEDILREAQTLLGTQYRIARRMLSLGLLFRGVAYLIGMALLLRPLGLSTPDWLAAAFGLLLLIGTLVDQQVRPDVKFINAKGRFLHLTRVVTTGREGFKQLKSEGPYVQDAELVYRPIATAIDEVERAHHLDYAIIRRPLTSVMPASAALPTVE